MSAFIELKGIDYTYPKGKFALRDISFTMDRGKLYAVMGPNGSGKTTLSKIIAGVFRPRRGQYLLDGQDTAGLKLYQFGEKLGYLFQNPERQIFTQSVREEITFALSLRGYGEEDCAEICSRMLEKFSLSHLKDAAPLRLSRGEKQRLMLAAIMAASPEFLVLDEPSTALDQKRRRILYDTLLGLKADGVGIAVITHDEALVSACADCVIEMREGRILHERD